MFGIGLVEVFIVLIVALFVIGPDKIPEAAESLGKMVKMLKQAVNEIKRSVHDHPLRDQQDFDVPELLPEEKDEPKK